MLTISNRIESLTVGKQAVSRVTMDAPMLTERLLMRPFESDDAPAVLELFRDPEVDRLVAGLPNAGRLKESIMAHHTTADEVILDPDDPSGRLLKVTAGDLPNTPAMRVVSRRPPARRTPPRYARDGPARPRRRPDAAGSGRRRLAGRGFAAIGEPHETRGFGKG